MISPQDLGFELEKQIHERLAKHNIKCYRENDIKQIYNLHGVDHLIIHNDNIICIQDKWEAKTPKLKDINHFIQTAITIHTNHNKCKLFGLFISKKPCSSGGIDALARYEFKNITCSIMINLIDDVEKEIIQNILNIKILNMRDNKPHIILQKEDDAHVKLINEIITHCKTVRSNGRDTLIDNKYKSFDIIDNNYSNFDFNGIQEYLYYKSQDYFSIRVHILYEIHYAYTKLVNLFGIIKTNPKPYMKKWKLSKKHTIRFSQACIHDICSFGYGGDYERYGCGKLKKLLNMDENEITSEVKKAHKAKYGDGFAKADLVLNYGETVYKVKKQCKTKRPKV